MFDNLLDTDEPDGDGAIDEWRSGSGLAVSKVAINRRGDYTPPTEGIRVVDSRLYNQPALRLESLLNLLVCGLSEVSGKVIEPTSQRIIL